MLDRVDPLKSDLFGSITNGPGLMIAPDRIVSLWRAIRLCPLDPSSDSAYASRPL